MNLPVAFQGSERLTNSLALISLRDLFTSSKRTAPPIKITVSLQFS